jgi:hypothetical protein
MEPFPLVCLFVLGLVTGFSLASDLPIKVKFFILGFSSIVISLTFTAHALDFGRKENGQLD